MYRMPDAMEEEEGKVKDKKFALLNKRYDEEKIELTEQELWEGEQ